MESRGLFANLSPLDHRYYHSNPELFGRLSSYLSEDASVRACVRVEAALFAQHLAHFHPGLSSAEISKFSSELLNTGPEEVYAEEEKTRHNIRALVNVLQTKVAPVYRNLIHLGATSADILDTATALRYRELATDLLLPLLDELVLALADIVDREASTPQVGRTHGQFAVPISLGYALAEYLSRLDRAVEEMGLRARDLRGKLSGAVGAYNAMRLVTEDPRAYEQRVLGRLGLEAAEHATQIVQPEFVLRLLLETNVAFGIIANLADDLRNLQRSEIGEVREYFAADQVGSSTMPQKRNPWNSEHVKSLWKAFSPRILSFYMDQISEHQRDLTNSASSRFVADYLAGFAAAVSRMLSILRGLSADHRRLEENLSRGGDAPLAEAAYILLALDGESDAHERVRRLTLDAEAGHTSLLAALTKDGELFGRLERSLARVGLGPAGDFFAKPARYMGLAAERAHAIADRVRRAAASRAEDRRSESAAAQDRSVSTAR